jgi:hypothetical protein
MTETTKTCPIANRVSIYLPPLRLGASCLTKVYLRNIRSTEDHEEARSGTGSFAPRTSDLATMIVKSSLRFLEETGDLKEDIGGLGHQNSSLLALLSSVERYFHNPHRFLVRARYQRPLPSGFGEDVNDDGLSLRSQSFPGTMAAETLASGKGESR